MPAVHTALRFEDANWQKLSRIRSRLDKPMMLVFVAFLTAFRSMLPQTPYMYTYLCVYVYVYMDIYIYIYIHVLTEKMCVQMDEGPTFFVDHYVGKHVDVTCALNPKPLNPKPSQS